MAQPFQVRNWARKLYKRERLDSMERQKVTDTIQNSGHEGNIVKHLVNNGKLPPGVASLPGEKVD